MSVAIVACVRETEISFPSLLILIPQLTKKLVGNYLQRARKPRLPHSRLPCDWGSIIPHAGVSIWCRR